MSNLELMRSVIMDVDKENYWLQEQCYEALSLVIESGLFQVELGRREYEQLRLAYGVVDELVAARDWLLTGAYPQAGEPLQSLELYGLYRCLYRYERGIEYVNYFRLLNFYDMPVVRVYVNRCLVGLFILGRRVMDYYSPYFSWLRRQGVAVPMEEVLGDE